MKNFDFGVHISLPTNNLELADGIASCVQKVAVQMQEKIDEEIIREIVKVAKEQGITDLYVLDKKNIKAALRKQIPMKLEHSETYAHTCPACDGLIIYDCFGYGGKHCRDCGQALDWSGTK